MGEIKILYICDPEKNVNCNKDMCHTECFYTTHREFRKSDVKSFFNGKRIVPVEVKIVVEEPKENA